MSERELGQLLQEVTPQPPVSIDFDQLAARARRRRSMLGATFATAVVLAGAAVATPALLFAGGGTTRVVPITPAGRSAVYSVDAPLLSMHGDAFTACFLVLTSLPPAGCGGVPIAGDVPLAKLPAVTRYRGGEVMTGVVHLAGYWNGHALVLTEPVRGAEKTTPGRERRCPPSVNPTEAETVQHRIGADTAVLRERGVVVLQTSPCGANVAVLVAVADRDTVGYLTKRYGNVVVDGWLRPTGRTTSAPEVTTPPNSRASNAQAALLAPPKCPAKSAAQPTTDLRITATNKGGGWFDPPCLYAPRGTPLRLTFTNEMFTLDGHKPIPLVELLVYRSRDLPRVRPGVPYGVSSKDAITHTPAGRDIATNMTIQLSIPALQPGTYTILGSPGYPQASATLVVS